MNYKLYEKTQYIDNITVQYNEVIMMEIFESATT